MSNDFTAAPAQIFEWKCPQLKTAASGALYADEEESAKTYLMINAMGISLPTPGKYERFDLTSDCIKFVDKAPSPDMVFEHDASCTRSGVLYTSDGEVIPSSKISLVIPAGSTVPSKFAWALYVKADVVVKNGILKASMDKTAQETVARGKELSHVDRKFLHIPTPRVAPSLLKKTKGVFNVKPLPPSVTYRMENCVDLGKDSTCYFEFPQSDESKRVMFGMESVDLPSPLPAGKNMKVVFEVPRMGMKDVSDNQLPCPVLVFPNPVEVEAGSAALQTASGSFLADSCVLSVPRCMPDDVQSVNCVWKVTVTYSSKEPVTAINMVMFDLVPDFIARTPIYV
jgi:hypothetical protein